MNERNRAILDDYYSPKNNFLSLLRTISMLQILAITVQRLVQFANVNRDLHDNERVDVFERTQHQNGEDSGLEQADGHLVAHLEDCVLVSLSVMSFS